MKMKEIQEAASLIQEQAHEDANIIFGAPIDEAMADMIKVTVIATGFDRLEDEIPVEISRETVRPASAPRRELSGALREGFSPAPPPAARGPLSRALDREPVPAYTRRSASVAASLQAGSSGNALPVRERIQFPQQQLDTDWDTPAFQRRNGGGGG